MEQPNKLMTWDEMVEVYPGRWVIVEKTKGNPSTIDEGIVKYVADDNEISGIWIKCLDNNLDYHKRRTTVEPFMGIADGVNFEITSKEIFKDES